MVTIHYHRDRYKLQRESWNKGEYCMVRKIVFLLVLLCSLASAGVYEENCVKCHEEKCMDVMTIKNKFQLGHKLLTLLECFPVNDLIVY